MFYQTKVKSIFPGGIIDVHNKRLVFVGNKLARVGDLVWTDGSVVLGHTPIRGGGAFFDSSIVTGVPVIGDGFEGYFDLKGNFHSAKLPVSGYFLNDDKCYYTLTRTSRPYDAELYTNSNGKTIGLIYAIHASGLAIAIYLKGNSKLTEYNYDVTRTGQFSGLSLLSSYYFLDKSADFFYLTSTSNSTYADRETLFEYYDDTYYATPAYCSVERWYSNIYRNLCKNSNIEQIYYHLKTTIIDWGSIFTPEDIVNQARAIAEGAKADPVISITDTFFPLQDGFKLYYNDSFQIFTPEGYTIDIPFLSDNPKNIPIVQLSQGRYLFSCSQGMYLYDNKNGLKQVLKKTCSNFRLRKMKNVLNAKVIT